MWKGAWTVDCMKHWPRAWSSFWWWRLVSWLWSKRGGVLQREAPPRHCPPPGWSRHPGSPTRWFSTWLGAGCCSSCKLSWCLSWVNIKELTSFVWWETKTYDDHVVQWKCSSLWAINSRDQLMITCATRHCQSGILFCPALERAGRHHSRPWRQQVPGFLGYSRQFYPHNVLHGEGMPRWLEAVTRPA